MSTSRPSLLLMSSFLFAAALTVAAATSPLLHIAALVVA